MSFGLGTYNDAGQLAFTTEAHCYYFVEKGFVDVYDSYSDFTGYLFSVQGINLNYDFDQIAFACDTGWVVPQSLPSVTGNSWPARYAIARTSVNDAPGVPHRVYYWTFRSSRFLPKTNTGFGMEVYDASGQVCFNSNAKPLLARPPLKWTSLPWTTPNTSLPGGGAGWAFIGFGLNNVDGYSLAVRRTSGGFSISSSFGFSGDEVNNGGFMAVDISGY